MGHHGRGMVTAGTRAVSAPGRTTLGGEPAHSLFHLSYKHLPAIPNGTPGILSRSGPGVLPGKEVGPVLVPCSSGDTSADTGPPPPHRGVSEPALACPQSAARPAPQSSPTLSAVPALCGHLARGGLPDPASGRPDVVCTCMWSVQAVGPGALASRGQDPRSQWTSCWAPRPPREAPTTDGLQLCSRTAAVPKML